MEGMGKTWWIAEEEGQRSLDQRQIQQGARFHRIQESKAKCQGDHYLVGSCMGEGGQALEWQLVIEMMKGGRSQLTLWKK